MGKCLAPSEALGVRYVGAEYRGDQFARLVADLPSDHNDRPKLGIIAQPYCDDSPIGSATIDWSLFDEIRAVLDLIEVNAQYHDVYGTQVYANEVPLAFDVVVGRDYGTPIARVRTLAQAELICETARAYEVATSVSEGSEPRDVSIRSVDSIMTAFAATAWDKHEQANVAAAETRAAHLQADLLRALADDTVRNYVELDEYDRVICLHAWVHVRGFEKTDAGGAVTLVGTPHVLDGPDADAALAHLRRSERHVVDIARLRPLDFEPEALDLKAIASCSEPVDFVTLSEWLLPGDEANAA